MSKGFRRIAYTRFGKYMERILPRFSELGLTLRKAGMDISLRMYLSTAFLTTFISMFAGFPAGIGIFWAINGEFLSISIFLLISLFLIIG